MNGLTDPAVVDDRRPNILVIVADQHRADWAGDRPSIPLRTPVLDALRRRAVTFCNVTTPAPVCAPARACLATGRDYDRGLVANNTMDLPAGTPTYYRQLRDAGYHVAGVGKFDLHKGTPFWGPDGSHLLRDRGFDSGVDSEGKRDAVLFGWPVPTGPYMAHLAAAGLAGAHAEDLLSRHLYFDTHPTPLPDDAYIDNWVGANTRTELNLCPKDRPWHLVVNFAGPHDPMDVTMEMQRGWQDIDFPLPVANTTVPPERHQRVRRNYAAMIENIDRQVGLLLQGVESRKETDRTIVIYTADHGEMLGDHDMWGKNTYYQGSIGIPLVIAVPGVPSRETSALASLEDVAATIVDFADAELPPGANARSLRRVLAGSDQHREHLVSGLVTTRGQGALIAKYAVPGVPTLPANWRAIFDGRHKLVISPVDSIAMFDVAADPDECRDVLHQQAAVAVGLYDRLLDDIGADWPKHHGPSVLQSSE